MERQPNRNSMLDVGAALDCSVWIAIVAPAVLSFFYLLFLSSMWTHRSLSLSIYLSLALSVSLSLSKVLAFILRSFHILQKVRACPWRRAMVSAGEGRSARYPRHVVRVQSWCIETWG